MTNETDSQHGPADLSAATAIVTGASRGFGRAIADALAGAGAKVVGLARSGQPPLIQGDATNPAVADELIRVHRPTVLVLNAGAVPPLGPIHELTWEQFSQNWHVDVRQAFVWASAALTAPLAPGSVVVAVSSGAALRGSPVSGGYAGAKATVRFVNGYAAAESARLGLGLRFVTLLPQLTPATDLGAAGVAAYAEREGVDVASFVQRLQPIVTPELVGRAVVEVIGGAALPPHAEYRLMGSGLEVIG